MATETETTERERLETFTKYYKKMKEAEAEKDPDKNDVFADAFREKHRAFADDYAKSNFISRSDMDRAPGLEYLHEQGRNPWPIRINWWLVAAIVVMIALNIYIYRLRTSESVKAAEHDKTEIVQEIDSLTAKQAATAKRTVKYSQTQATKADSLFKTIPNEKPIIRDTSFTAMYQYITKYKYGGRRN